MARAKPYSDVISIPEAMRSSELTIPGVELYHYITDDQLTELSTMRAEPVMEVAMGSAGAFVGSLIPALEALVRFNDKTNPMGYIGLFSLMLAIVSLALAGFSGFLWYKRYKRHVGLAATIRSRPKVKVTPVNDGPSGGSKSGQVRPIP